MGIESPIHLAFVAIVALLVLGPRRLPEVARTLGNGLREFREAMSGETILQDGEHRQPRAAAPVPDPSAPAPHAAGAPSGPSADAPVPDPSAPEPPHGSWTSSGSPAPSTVPHEAAAVGSHADAVDPGEPLRSGDAPDSRPL